MLKRVILYFACIRSIEFLLFGSDTLAQFDPELTRSSLLGIGHWALSTFCQNPNGVCVCLFEYRLFSLDVLCVVENLEVPESSVGLCFYYVLDNLVHKPLHVSLPLRTGSTIISRLLSCKLCFVLYC